MSDNTCSKCRGSGKLPKFAHVDGGKCYQCNGTGELTFANWKSEWLYQVRQWYDTPDYKEWIQKCKEKSR